MKTQKNISRKKINNFNRKSGKRKFKIINKEEALKEFRLYPAIRKLCLVLGGSLGAGSINKAVALLIKIKQNEIQVIWQTGKNYYEKYKNR